MEGGEAIGPASSSRSPRISSSEPSLYPAWMALRTSSFWILPETINWRRTPHNDILWLMTLSARFEAGNCCQWTSVLAPGLTFWTLVTKPCSFNLFIIASMDFWSGTRVC